MNLVIAAWDNEINDFRSESINAIDGINIIIASTDLHSQNLYTRRNGNAVATTLNHHLILGTRDDDATIMRKYVCFVLLPGHIKFIHVRYRHCLASIVFLLVFRITNY